jgi:hypothetical protein
MSADRPRPSAKQATLAALGLGAAATSAAGAAGAVGGIAGISKLLALGALAGVVATGAMVGAQHALSPAAAESAPSVVLSSSSRDPVVPGTPAGAGVPRASFDGQSNADTPPTSAPARLLPRGAPSGGSERSEASRDRIDAPSAPAPLPPATEFDEKPTDSSLRDETRELDRARAAIARGNPRAALAELDRYDAAFRPGALAPEATLLRVRALLAAGDRAGAQTLARSFAAAHPESPHLAQLRGLLAP